MRRTGARLGTALLAALCCAAVVMAAEPASIVDAAQQGDRAAVESLLRKGVNVNTADGDGATALHYAAWRGDAALADALLAHGADVKATTTIGGYTPLDLAAQVGSGAVVKLLIQHGADVNAATKTGTTPLMLAAGAGDVASVEALLAAGARPNVAETEFGQTPLMFAVDRDRAPVVALLLKHGADPNASTKVVDLAAYSKNGINPDGRNLPALGRELDAQKAGKGKVRTAKGVPGVDRPYFQNELVGSRGGMTPLLFAVRDGYADIAKMLLDAGVNVNQLKGGDHSSALLVATVNGQFDLGKMLIDRGADVNLANDANVTPLFATINLQWHPRSYYPQPQAYLHQQINYLQYMKLLLDKGAKPNVRLKRGVWFFAFNSDQSSIDMTGATPFWRAAYGADVDAMKLLVQYGADPTLGTLKPPTRRFGPATAAAKADPSGMPEVPVGGPDVTPLLAASGEAYGWSFTANSHRVSPAGMLPAVKYLVDVLHADVNQRDADGNTPLHNAASRGDNEMIMYLVSKGADVTAMNRNGQSVADMANGPYQRTQPFPQTVALLRKLGAKIVHECVTCK